MKAVKEIIRFVTKGIGGIAAALFLMAPFRDFGWMVMAGAIFVAIICAFGYMWSEPDEDPPPSEDSN